MRLCFSTLVCPNWSFPQIIGAAAAYGLEGIDPRGIGPEIDVTRLNLFDGELDATMELLKRHGLSIPCLNTSIALVTPAEDRWEMMLDECQRHARLAGRMETRYLRIFGGSVPRGMTRAEATSMARRHLRQLVKLCDVYRCQPLLETHDQWAVSERIMELLADFAPQEAGVLWDVEHAYWGGESPAGTAEALRRYVLHVHMKDSVRRDGKSLPRLLGEGDLPLERIIQAMRGVGYDGWVCLETAKRWHTDDAPEPEVSLPQFVRYMREHWEQSTWSS